MKKKIPLIGNKVRKHGVDSVDDSDYDGDHDADGDGDDGDDGDGGVDYDRQCRKRDFVLLNSFNRDVTRCNKGSMNKADYEIQYQYCHVSEDA